MLMGTAGLTEAIQRTEAKMAASSAVVLDGAEILANNGPDLRSCWCICPSLMKSPLCMAPMTTKAYDADGKIVGKKVVKLIIINIYVVCVIIIFWLKMN